MNEELIKEEAVFPKDNLSEELISNRIKKFEASFSLDSFVAGIDGRWILYTKYGSPNSVVNDLTGDIIWIDRSWLATGNAIWEQSISGQKVPISWSIDYDQDVDSITWTIGGHKEVFENVSSDNSIQMRYDIPREKLILLIRDHKKFGDLILRRGAYVKVG